MARFVEVKGSRADRAASGNERLGRSNSRRWGIGPDAYGFRALRARRDERRMRAAWADLNEALAAAQRAASTAVRSLGADLNEIGALSVEIDRKQAANDAALERLIRG